MLLIAAAGWEGDYFKNICVLTTDFGGTPQFPFKTLRMPACE